VGDFFFACSSLVACACMPPIAWVPPRQDHPRSRRSAPTQLQCLLLRDATAVT